jgi:hypothetical protein
MHKISILQIKGSNRELESENQGCRAMFILKNNAKNKNAVQVLITGKI